MQGVDRVDMADGQCDNVNAELQGEQTEGLGSLVDLLSAPYPYV